MSSLPNGYRLTRGAIRGLASVFAVAITIGSAVAQQAPMLDKGNAVITGFSGTAASPTSASTGNPIDQQFIDVTGASARIMSIPLPGPPQGQLIPSTTVLPIKAGDVGQVFGIALDDGKGPASTGSGVPDIYLNASSAFGLQIVAPDASGKLQRLHAGQSGAQWMVGQWGDATKSGTPGSIWKVSGTTGEVSLFANVKLNGEPNSGPGLGNIAFDAKTRQIFVSDLETGMIHRFDMAGQDLGYFDHGTQGKVAQGLPPVPYDPANRLDITNPSFSVDDATTWHYAPKGRMVWGLKISAGRLYYATADGPQVWSISIGTDGSFGNDPQLEVDVTGTPNNNVISDITFDGPDTIYLAQRGTAHGDYSYKTFADPAKSSVIRYTRDPQTGKWSQTFQEYAVGFPPQNRNTNGGVAIDTCNSLVWTTGELLRVGSGLGDPEVVHGLQGMDKSLVLPAHVPPKQSYFVAYNPDFVDPDAHGHMGDVEIWHPCQSQGAITPPQPPSGSFNLTLTKQASPYVCPPGVYCKQPAPGVAPTDCVPSAQGGWLCSYVITVKNTGTTPFVGPLTVDDWLPAAPTGANMTFSPTPPWFCTMTGPDAYQCVDPAVTLNPGDSIDLNVVVELPPSYHLCFLDNAASIEWPGGYGDADPSDDAAFASAHIPGSYCQPPEGNKTNLFIQKYAFPYCKPGHGDYLCLYLVKVGNAGPGVYSDKIVVAETLPAGDTIVATSAPWICAGGPPTYSCSHPPVTLNPAQSVGMFVLVKVPFNFDKPICDVTNHVHITYAPGGSDENTNPADDDASATAHIPSDKCLGQKTNLKIEKFGQGCANSVLINAPGYDCYYSVKVTNTGPGLYNGPVVVSDVFSPAPVKTATFNPTPPWSCSGSGANYQCTDPAVSLAPSQSVTLLVHGVLGYGDIRQGQCTLTNTAHIQTPAGGSDQNTNPGDDTASASDTVKSELCNPQKPLGAIDNTGHVSILKTCKPSAAGSNVICQIKLTNDGGEPISSAINFNDRGEWSAGGAPMHVLSTKPDNPAVACGGLPDSLDCSVPGSALPPGTSVSVEVTLAADPSQLRFKNCATLVSVDGSPLTGPGHSSCVEGGGEITVVKTGPATCYWNQACTFEVAVTNSSNSPYSGPLLVGDALFLDNNLAAGLPVAVTQPFGCPSDPTSLPFDCLAVVSLMGGEHQFHSVAVTMPAGSSNESAVGLNCAFVTDGSGSMAAHNGAGPVPSGFTPKAGNGPGYSCVPFKVIGLKEREKLTCPGDEVRIGTQCQCPSDTVSTGNFRCRPTRGGTTIVPVPIPIPTGCIDPARRMTDGDCCPAGSRAFGNSCVTPPTTVCPRGSFGHYPNCVCEREYGVYNAASNSCGEPPKSCQLPLVGDYPNCHCPNNGSYDSERKTCGSGEPTRKCPHNQIGTPPNCTCPSGTKIDSDGFCAKSVETCPAPAIGTLPNCSCPSAREVWNGKTCVLKTTGGNEQQACPRPAHGMLPNCSCPGTMTWNGSSCVAPKSSRTEGTNNKSTGNSTTTTTSKCPAGEHWTGTTCLLSLIHI